PISPDIYGLVFGDDAQLPRLGVTVRRHGGNSWSRYNWKTSTTNTGGDGRFFHGVGVDAGTDNSADRFVEQTRAGAARAIIDLPTLGFVNAAAGTCGFSVAKYGVQKVIDPDSPDCADGVLPTGAMVTGNDPLDTSIAAGPAWSQEWVAHLVARFGTAANGGVRFYSLSNQPALWHETHRDVHPERSSYAELKAGLELYGKAVKDADPSALTLGPGAWGWLEYFDSAAGDRAKTGIDFLPYYLSQARAYELANGRRILDYLDIHVYPQSAGVTSGDVSPATSALRLRSTRILWDPSYAVESWESCCNGGVLNVLPRMQQWITGSYPGTRLSISSYAWGAIDTPNGALAQADVLGIFGREGVDLATLQDPPANGSIGEDAFKLFRNYDGAGARFGNTSIRAASANPMLSSFAAFDGAAHVTVVLVNKDPAAADSVTLGFAGMGPSGTWRAFQFGAGGRLAAAGSGTVTGGKLTHVVPPSTAVLIEFIPEGGLLAPAPDAGSEPVADAGSTPAPTATPKGCSATGGAFGLVALVGMLLRRRNAAWALCLLGANAFAAPVTVTVDASQDRRPIAPGVYASLGNDAEQQASAEHWAVGVANGQLAKTMLFGIFGRDGVTSTPSGDPLVLLEQAADRLYGNYDGAGGRFGTTSIAAHSSDSAVSAFASFDDSARVTVVLVNKSLEVAAAVELGFKGIGQQGAWRAFALNAAGQISPAGTGTTWDAVIPRSLMPTSALLVEFNPVGGILPIRPAVQVDPPALAAPSVVSPQTAGCSSVGGVSLGLLALLGLGLQRRPARPARPAPSPLCAARGAARERRTSL
ncbi:MAG: hypothetical protein H6Q89_2848, partial [Myxococcaceae bacterium]|nr:hypothetical protein [Myxococcaceae bacterium]